MIFVAAIALHSLKLTANAPKNGWLDYYFHFPIGFRPIFRCELAVSFREGNFMAGQPTPPLTYPPRTKGLIAGLIKGNQQLISPDHKACYFWGGVRGPGGGWLNSHDN